MQRDQILYKKGTTENTTKLAKFRILNNIIFIHRLIKRGSVEDEYLVPYVPKSLMIKAYKLVHEDMKAGHKGFDRTLKLFRKNFYNNKEKTVIKKMCQNCELCIKAKANPKQVPIGKYPIPTVPFTTIGSDILGPLRITAEGNKYVLVFRDYTTRYSIFEALPNKDTESIIKALRKVISNFGSAGTLLTDNAAEYKSEKLNNFCAFYNIRKIEYANYHPSSGGLQERMNRELNKMIRIYVSELANNDWDEFLPTVQLTINNTYNEMIGETPFLALFRYDSPSVSLTSPKINFK